MKILITIAAFAASFLSATMLFAGGAGSSAGLTLAETISAQTAGISESATALSGSINLIASNPAAIHSLEGNQASINYRAGLGEDMLASLLYGRRFSFASLGIAVNYYSTGEITMYDLSGNAVKKTGKEISCCFWAQRESSMVFRQA